MYTVAQAMLETRSAVRMAHSQTVCGEKHFEWRAGCAQRRKSGSEKSSGVKLLLAGWVGPGLFYIHVIVKY